MRRLRKLQAICPVTIAMAFLVAAETQARDTPSLVDVTASTGVHFKHLSSPEQAYIVESMSGGVALLDYDGDGWLDV